MRDLLAQLKAAAPARPSDAALLELLHVARGAPQRLPTPAAWGPAQPPSPILVAVFSAGDQRLRFFSTLTRLMSVRDVGLEEVGIECSHPADDATRRFCVALDDSEVARS